MNAIQIKSSKTLLESHCEKRTKCLVYTRVMGYHRPVESFNKGKKGEHQKRTYFSEELGKETHL